MKHRLVKSTAVVSVLTLLSRVFGLLRDVVFARFLGASQGPGMDAFLVALRLPNFVRRLFAEGAFSQAFVPVFADARARGDLDQVRTLARDVAGTLGLTLTLLTLLAMLAAPLLVAIFAFGFLGQPQKFDLTVELLRVTLPYVVFISLAALAGGVLNTYGRFGIPAFTPVILNLCLIACAVWLAPRFAQPVEALAWGVFAAGLLQLAVQLPALARLRLLAWPRWAWQQPQVQTIRRSMLPALFGSSVTQVNLLFDIVVASALTTGSISWLYYSDRLIEFPLGVFGMAIATVILPELSRHFVAAEREDFSRLLDWALRWVILLGLPATVGLMALAMPLLATFFLYGKFTLQDTHMSALSLITYGLGLLAYLMIKVLTPGFYARQDNHTPVRSGVVAMVSNVVLVLLIVVPWAYWGIPGPHAGLALATSLAAYINAALLLRVLRRQGVYRPESGWRRFLLQVVAASGGMAALLLVSVPTLQEWVEWGLWMRVSRLLFWVVAGAGCYLMVLLALGWRPAAMKLR